MNIARLVLNESDDMRYIESMKYFSSTHLSTVKKPFLGLGAALMLALALGVGMPAGVKADVCIRNNPAVTYTSAASQSGDPGQTVSYQVNVTNTDSVDCGNSTQFIDTNNVPTGWTVSFPETFISTSPGQSLDYTIDVTSPTNAQNGDVNFVFNAYQSMPGQVDLSSDINLTYTVVNAPADTTAPVVTIVSPTNGSTVAKNSDVLIQATATDFVGVTNIAFYVDGQLLCTGSTAGTCVWHSPKQHGSHTIEVRASDAAGNTGVTTSSVTIH